jgi:hypothetical protein
MWRFQRTKYGSYNGHRKEGRKMKKERKERKGLLFCDLVCL